MTSPVPHTSSAILMTSAGPFDKLDPSGVSNQIICEVFGQANGRKKPQGITWQHVADLISTKYSGNFSATEVRSSVTSVKEKRNALNKNRRPGDDLKLQCYLNETFVPPAKKEGKRKLYDVEDVDLPPMKKSTVPASCSTPETMGKRRFTPERKPTSRSSELLQGSSLVHHRYFDPFMKAFEIQTSEGLVKRYKLTSTRDERDARQTLGETLTASADESSEVTSVERGKMVRLQKQLLEIRKKQGEYQKQMSEERQKVASLEARIRELETDQSGGGSSQDIMQSNDVTGRRLTKHQVITGASQFLGEPVLSFFTHQIKGTDGGPPRWNKEMRKISLEVYERSPSAYKFLEEFFTLPSVDSLQAWLDGEDSLEESATRTCDTVEGLEGIAEEPAAIMQNVASSVALGNTEDTDVAMDSDTAVDLGEDVAKLSENSKEVEDIASTDLSAGVLAGNSEASNTEMKSAANEDLPDNTSKLSENTNEHNGATENTTTGSIKELEGGADRLSGTNDVGSSDTAAEGIDSDSIKLLENMEDSGAGHMIDTAGNMDIVDDSDNRLAENPNKDHSDAEREEAIDDNHEEEEDSSAAVRPKSPETVIVYLDCLHPLKAKKRKL